ncbi:MAG TPA: hypothetical protein VMB34_04130 [Acetobacteraceae bacterium]|nr:hypothetical protein [Acetobacteraceae bacterium]
MPFDAQNMFIVDASLLGHTAGGSIAVSAYDIAATGWNCTTPGNAPVACQVVAARGRYGAGGTPNHIEDLMIFWCGYAQDQIHFSVLSGASGPSVMLTPTMDGCTFGIGHSARDGTCVVTHANNAAQQGGVDDPGTMPQAQRQATRGLFRTLGVKLKYTMQPDNYRWADEGQGRRMIASASTYGIRAAAHWRFYKHRYLVGMGDYVYLDTTRIR